ncbi:MAG: metallophosphoesterase family protein [Patescibacteria group bacterium]
MKIAIISDTHDNIPNLEKTINWLKSEGISLIIHCGDLCSPSFLSKVLAPSFSGEIHLIYGNVGDRELLEEKIKELKNVKYYSNQGEIELDGKKIAFVHYREKAKKLAETGKYDIIFYGHTHKPWIEELKIENCKLKIVKLVNPGTLAGMFNKATFAVYDTKTDNLELKILEIL